MFSSKTGINKLGEFKDRDMETKKLIFRDYYLKTQTVFSDLMIINQVFSETNLILAKNKYYSIRLSRTSVPVTIILLRSSFRWKIKAAESTDPVNYSPPLYHWQQL